MDRIKKVLITGGCGRIGRRVTAKLMSLGMQVRVADMITGAISEVEYVKGDIINYDEMLAATSGVDYVIHLAAIPVENGKSQELFKSNVEGVFNVIDSAAKNGVKGFVFASTVSTYALLHPSLPFKPSYFPVDEEIPRIPDRNYGSMKIIGENFLQAYSRLYNMDCIALRIATVMNPGTENWKKLYDNIHNPEHVFVGNMTMRDFMWQYVHVYDVAQAFAKSVQYIAEQPGFGFEPFNIGAKECACSVPSLELIRRYFPDVPILKYPAMFVENPNAALYGIEKARRVLGYEPQYSWRDQQE